MNDHEKTYEAFRATDWLCECFEDYKDEIIDKFQRGTKFPYTQRIRCVDDKGNIWWFTCIMPHKDFRKKAKFLTFCYTMYDIPPKRSENLTNAGKGALVFDPLAMRRYLKTKVHEPGSIITDITPHAVNRYTDRYLKPNGKTLEPERKIESILSRWMHFDICADLAGDKNTAKHKDEGICPIDIIMRGGGMFRGNVISNLLMRLTTYVSTDIMFDNQKERQQEMVSEYFNWKRKKII